MLSVMILDDSENEALRIKEILLNKIDFFKGLRVEYALTVPEMETLRDYKLFIMDINMGEVNGIRLAEQIMSVNEDAGFIFCSNYPDLVFDTFAVNVLYFVRKSNLETDLIRAMEKYKALKPERLYVLQSGGEQVMIPYKKILYFEGQRNYIAVKLANNTVMRERKTLRALHDEIRDSFIPLSYSLMVNPALIEKIKDEYVYLKNGERLFIAFQYRKSVKSLYNNYLIKNV